MSRPTWADTGYTQADVCPTSTLPGVEPHLYHDLPGCGHCARIAANHGPDPVEGDPGGLTAALQESVRRARATDTGGY